MDYKEKLEEAKKLYASANVDQKYVLESLFPELTEQKGEKVKQKIINLIKKSNEVGGWALHKWEADEMLAWLENQGQKPIMNVPSREVILSIWDLGNEWKELTNGSISTEHGTQLDYIQNHWHESEYYLIEKQGKQSLVDKPELKFHEGEWCIDNEDGVIFQIVKVLDNTYTYKTNEGKEYSCTHYSLENDAKLWTIQDAKDGDVLEFGDHGRLVTGIVSYVNKTTGKVDVSCLLEGDKFKVGVFYNLDTIKPHPATKEQCDTLFAKMREAGYIFDFEKKELKNIEDEEYNGEDYGIDSLYHAKQILEKTLGEVDGYQTDDGILDHKCAITAIKKLYEQKPVKCIKFNNEFENQVSNLLASVLKGEHEYNESFVKYVAQSLLGYAKNELKTTEWSEEDEKRVNRISDFIWKNRKGDTDEIYQQEQDVNWIKSIKYRVQPTEWSEEDKSMYIRTLGILGKCYMGELPDKVEDELKWLKSLTPQKSLRQIYNTVDLTKNGNEASSIELLYNELKEKFKGESIKVII